MTATATSKATWRKAILFGDVFTSPKTLFVRNGKDGQIDVTERVGKAKINSYDSRKVKVADATDEKIADAKSLTEVLMMVQKFTDLDEIDLAKRSQLLVKKYEESIFGA